MRAARPEEMSSKVTSASAVTEAPEQSWGNTEQNHLPPRGDISDLVLTGGQGGIETEDERIVKRLSNGISGHAPKESPIGKEEEEIETGPSAKGGTVVNGDSRQEVEMEGEEKRSSVGSSDDELRQSVGSVTSSEFNPGMFGAVHDEEMRQEGEAGLGKWPEGDRDTTAATNTTASLVSVSNVCVCVCVCACACVCACVAQCSREKRDRFELPYSRPPPLVCTGSLKPAKFFLIYAAGV